jgi:hypothetical protein
LLIRQDNSQGSEKSLFDIIPAQAEIQVFIGSPADWIHACVRRDDYWRLHQRRKLKKILINSGWSKKAAAIQLRANGAKLTSAHMGALPASCPQAAAISAPRLWRM